MSYVLLSTKVETFNCDIVIADFIEMRPAQVRNTIPVTLVPVQNISLVNTLNGFGHL